MRSGNPFVAWILGALVPGAGHLYLGRKAQGWVFFAALAGTFAAGAAIARGAALSADAPHYLVLQAGAGLPAALAWWLRDTGPSDVEVALRETAVLYTVLPALLNVIVALDAAAKAAGPAPAAAGAGATGTGDAGGAGPGPTAPAAETTTAPAAAAPAAEPGGAP